MMARLKWPESALGLLSLNTVEQTGQLTVIVLNNASVHRSKLVQQQQGLLLFFLPPYSSQMNRIEDEWLQLKRTELAGRGVEDDVDLACDYAGN